MERKVLVKRIACIAVCLVMIIVSCILFYDFNAVKVGAGGGTNAKITSMQEMGVMLESFSPQLTDYDFSGSLGDLYNENESSEGQQVGKYKSVSFSEESSAYVKLKTKRSIGNSSYDGFSVATYQRFMQVYIAECATYYHSEFTVSSDARTPKINGDSMSPVEYDLSYSDIILDMDILIAENRVLIKINKAHMAMNGVNSYMFEHVLGRWGDFTDDVSECRSIISEFNSVNRMNFKILSVMGRYVENYNSDRFTKYGDTYELKQSSFNFFATELLAIVDASLYLDENSLSGEFTVDLGDAEQPIVSLALGNNYSNLLKLNEKDYLDVSLEYSEHDEFTFSAINNTVIDGYDDITTVPAKEYSALLVRTK